MQFNPPLQSATLIKRYKRFLADVQTSSGEILTIHCPNTGAMTGCGEQGDTIWYSYSDNPKRKYPHTWELTENKFHQLICVNTQRANQLVKEKLLSNPPEPFLGYSHCYPERKFGEEGSRIDFFLKGEDLVDCYIEVKSVTLEIQQNGFFPDAITTRGQKHLRELIHIKQSGKRAVLLFIVLHSGIHSVAPAAHIDPEYTRLLREAKQYAVEIIAWKASLSPQNISLKNANFVDIY